MSRCGEGGLSPGPGLSAGNPRLLVMTRVATFIPPANIYYEPVMCQTGYQGHSVRQSRNGLALLECAPLLCFTEEAWTPEGAKVAQGCMTSWR